MACHGGPDIIEDNLVLCLDAGNIKSYPGSGTTWSDLIGSNNGTLINGPTFSSDDGGVIVFDSTNDYVKCARNSDFAFGTGDFSISCWYYITSNNQNQTLFDTRYNGGTRGLSPFFWNHGFKIWSDGIGGWYSSGETSDLNKWYNMIITRAGTTFKYYNNAVLNSNILTDVDYNFQDDNFVIGWNYSTQNNRSFGGKIGQVAVYKGYALTAAEVAQNYNALKGRFGL